MASTDAVVEPEDVPVSDSDAVDGDEADVGTDQPAETTVTREIDRQTKRWQGVSAFALLAGGAGILAEQPGLLLLAIVGVAYAAYARIWSAPTVDLAVERTVSDPEPEPGDEVRITVTVRNTGENYLPDLRLIDGVPPTLAVTDGSPRHGTALAPGGSDQFSYTISARRGDHEFEPMVGFARDVSGTVEREVSITSPTSFVCRPSLGGTTSVPLRQQTSQFIGRVTTDTSGSGIEFHSTREYRIGDPMNRIDWNRHARTGDLATIEFRQERAATVVLLIDAREEAYLERDEDSPNAVEQSVQAAGAVFTALLDSGDQVGIAAFGPEDCWLRPGSGREHSVHARTLLATHSALAPSPPDAEFFPTFALRRLRRRFPSDAQVIMFSPLCDDFIAEVARRLDAHGHRVTLISPDVTSVDTLGHRLATVERQRRLSELRKAGLRVVDWHADELLAVSLMRASERWSG